MLPRQLSVLEAMLKISCFDDILSAVTKVPEPEEKLVQEVQTIYWLLVVNAATYAAGLDSGWLRSRMDAKGLAAFAFQSSRSLG